MSHEAFDNAKFYDCRDPEILNHSEIEEAIADHLDWAWEKGRTPEQVAEEVCPLEVVAYNPVKKCKSSVAGRADYVIEELEDHLWEDYSDPEGNHDFWDREYKESLAKRLQALFDEAVEKMQVWQCEQVAKRSFSIAEVRKLVPDWFSDAGDQK